MTGVTKDRILELMGREDISVTNRDDMKLLQSALEKEYHRKQMEKERLLQDAERRRVRRLLVEGLIDMDPDYLEYSLAHPSQRSKVGTDRSRRHKQRGFKGDGRNKNELWDEFRPNPESGRKDYKYLKESDDNQHDKNDHITENVNEEEENATAAPMEESVARFTRIRSPNLEALLKEESMKSLYQKAEEVLRNH